ncbi:hypothetical protein HanPSC8_Chr04g0169601 [Helianthus annuus]|nr:hypothetical protein HanPSC8_Chr04g0169601 [Helianthus annuus]
MYLSRHSFSLPMSRDTNRSPVPRFLSIGGLKKLIIFISSYRLQ